VLDLGHLAAAVDRRLAASAQRLVEHAFDDHGAGRVVRARFGAEAEKAHFARIDIVTFDQAHDRRRGDRVNTLPRAAHAEAAPDHGLGLVPG
jgi:hypothetical protein